ncbi:MAG: alpha-amylase family glycosyl hydrolase, partial [Pararhizobium sp.]
LDTANFYFHNESLKDNPPLGAPDETEAAMGPNQLNPYEYQDHIYDKTQPENLDFLRRFRALLDSYGARTSVGEVSDGKRSLKTVAAYTGGGDKRHMCYTFDLLTAPLTAERFREALRAFQEQAEDGWVCWSFSNHDVIRHLTRWLKPGEDPDRLARLCAALISTLRGSICLYQGEELGLQESVLRFEDLNDPSGIRFWPAYKGRDGCRTPMVWEEGAANAGFSSANRSWLPVPEDHRAHAVDRQEKLSGSILNHYRAILRFRHEHAVLRDGDMHFLPGDRNILAFIREGGGERLLFAFNLDRTPADWRVPETLTVEKQIRVPGFAPVLSEGLVELEGLDVFCARLG